MICFLPKKSTYSPARVEVFDEEGHLLLFVGAGGARQGEFFLPAGLSIDSHDRVYVADQGNARVQVFQYLSGARR